MTNNRKCLAVLVACTAAAFVGCQPTGPSPASRPDLEIALQTLLDDAVLYNEQLPGIALHVDAPRLGLVWEGAAGVADPASGAPMTPQHPVLIASNTKTFISASILRLWEDGRLGLDDPIADHLSGEYIGLLLSGGYSPEKITVRHLLTHTSGIFDYADAEIYSEKIMADPMHRWTRTEQLRSAMEWGDPYGAPGEVYRYCDTGYILLGEILERTTGQPMPYAVRELVNYERLGLGSTWFETLEPRPDGVPDLAHQFWGKVDTADVDPSLDLYGGGGLASTVGDLARFMRAVFTGGVYTNTDTAQTMLTTVSAPDSGPDAYGSKQVPGTYRMGVSVVDVEGLITYRHTGFWGTVATYVPELDMTIAGTVNQNRSKGVLADIERRTLAIVRDAVEVE
jgi:D-alanyl-D-alanine carboxypeptidase